MARHLPSRRELFPLKSIPKGQTAIFRRLFVSRTLAFGLVLLACEAAWPAVPPDSAAYVGSAKCGTCHRPQYDSWRGSHHYQSMLEATSETVLGDFSGVEFEYAGVKSRFFKNGDKFMVLTDNARGELQEFEISHTFGFYPLQQYLIPFPDGRYQALNVVWDARPADEGGQRWYHLYPDDSVDHADSVHWTGSFQNWNSRCAACHSTQLEKRYSMADDSYATRWAEINVGCEACHGPASDHLAWAAAGSVNDERGDRGFPADIANHGAWGPVEGSATLGLRGGSRSEGQIEMCAACHSRRAEMDEQHAGKAFHDLYQLRLLEEGLYFADGQIRDEVYVYGSFLQSRMYQAGVTCTNCHEPHSNGLKAPGNALCSQCHDHSVFDNPAHHRHETGSEGADCVNCHMTVVTYMGVDDRHDHGFRVPEPRLTRALGIPNTCNQCHEDKPVEWAIEAMDGWGLDGALRATHAGVLARARRDQPGVAPDLRALAADTTKPAIIRATATLESSRFPSEETLVMVRKQLASDAALVRAAAVRSLDWLPALHRYTLLQPLIGDPARVVRMEVASQLADVPPEQITSGGRTDLAVLRNEYLDFLKLNADTPESLLNLGLFLSASGQPSEAERAYRQALKLSPSFIPVLLNLADLYRANGMDSQARPLLTQATKIAPNDAAAYHALGLLAVREKDLEGALPYLQRAVELSPGQLRYAYVYGVGLYEAGQRERSIAVLEAALESHPGNQDLVSALASYYRQMGENRKLEQLLDGNPN
jgi:predicted CXXCH cytochrome family protein